MEEKLYFAYGSNINLDQMAHRCPDATPVGPVMLENYELLFRGMTNHGGVATIHPKHGSYVYASCGSSHRSARSRWITMRGIPTFTERSR